MLKLTILAVGRPLLAAAFRRLCVETGSKTAKAKNWTTAAFRRLCVETVRGVSVCRQGVAAAFRRLCVETAMH